MSSQQNIFSTFQLQFQFFSKEMFIYFIPGQDSNKCIMAYFTSWLSSGKQKFKLLICVYTNIPFAFEKLNRLELPRRVLACLKKFQVLISLLL